MFPTFSFGSFIVLTLIFRIAIHLKLIVVCGIKEDLGDFSPYIYLVDAAPFVEKTFPVA